MIPEDEVSRTRGMQQVFSYRAGNETVEWWWRGLRLGAQEERGSSEDILLVFLVVWAFGLKKDSKSLFLRKDIPLSKWPMESKLKGIFGGFLSHNVISWIKITFTSFYFTFVLTYRFCLYTSSRFVVLRDPQVCE